MPTATRSNRARSLVRSTLVLLVAGGAGYVAGAHFRDPAASRELSAAFATPAIAQPLPPVEPSVQATPPAAASVPPAPVELGRSERDRILQPRECDLAQGISSDCLFMD